MDQPNQMITVTTHINAPLDKVWQCWTDCTHITHWNFASDDWHCPKAVHDFMEGGRFAYTMSAEDESFSFDYSGLFTNIVPHKSIALLLDDGRKVEISFEVNGSATQVTERFEPEQENPVEMQRMGWQAILDNFKQHVEGVM
ncbi:MAG: SRPBCC domain-containing protein [Saprospiraceae bacterium]|nr:SRPBCC domain-containing protein [Saprospiraceae bacterium]HMW40292.1 SRPBCC domain-containing protein [Saprospiraceae bacterium]HMZ40286.1 SRPBCC domain-containing protein [Saprospiraceae bacterium]HNA65136.1 SRPBCC domain-containing protein [Saprospiraceae bacterium]HNB29750.1 SRPBCC domain-containing protein [Saprospiraceae bacterium]